MLTIDLFTARSNLLPHAFVWAIYIYIGSIEETCRSAVAKIVLIGNLKWPPSCLCLLYFPATFFCLHDKVMILQKPLSQFPPNFMLILLLKCDCTNDHAPLTVRPIYSCSKLRTAQMMIFSLVAMIGLEKCCITSAYLHWLCHSGERALARGPLVRVRHIPGIFSVLADPLSKMDKPLKTEWAFDQSTANSIFQMLNYPNVDLFATCFSHKLSLYVSPVPDNQALAIDALSMNWNLLHAYAFQCQHTSPQDIISLI